MSQQNTPKRTNQLCVTSIFTALTCIATMIFTVYVPSTKGFFNIGETMVYTAALLFGPIVGAFSGGVGSMLADLLLGYYYYAPATLIIKALEGGVVGFLARKKPKFHTPNQWKIYTSLVGVVIGISLCTIGFFYYTGYMQLYWGIPPPENPASTMVVPAEFWFSLGALVAFLIAAVGFLSEPEFGWMILSVVSGGLLMVAGYFLYQQFFGQLFFSQQFVGVVAIAEIPINIGQMIIGLIISIPITKAVKQMLRS